MTATNNLAQIEAQLKEITAKHGQVLEIRQTVDAAEAARKSLETTIEGMATQIKGLEEARDHNKQFFAPGAMPFDPNTGKGFSMARFVKGVMSKDWTGSQYEYDVLKSCNLLPGSYQKAQGIQVDSTGGFALPENLVPGLIALLQTNTVFNAANIGVMEMPGVPGTMKFNRIGAGFTPGTQASEGGTLTDSTMTIQQIELAPKTLYTLVKCSNLMLANNEAGAEMWINAQISRDMAIARDRWVLRGTGSSGEPLGLLNDPDIGSESVADPLITYAEIEAIRLAVANANGIMGNKMAWAGSPTMLSNCRLAPSGLAGVDVVRLSRGEAANSPMIGYPVFESNNFTASTGADALVFGDWSRVIVANFSGLMIAASKDRYFDTDETGFRAIEYMDTHRLQPSAFAKSA